MAELNAFEFGQVVRANLNQDISTNIGLEFILQPKEGASKNVNSIPSNGDPRNSIIRTQADGVVVGAVDVVVGDQTFTANEYLEYTVKEDDLSVSGLWRIKGKAKISATNEIVGDFRCITVLD